MTNGEKIFVFRHNVSFSVCALLGVFTRTPKEHQGT